MSIATINVPVSVGAAAWERCIRETAARAHLFGVNETKSREQINLYRQFAREHELGTAGLDGSGNAVFWRKSVYLKISSRVVPLHPRGTGALARRYPGFNDARSVTEVVLMDKRTSEVVVMLCTHWVPEGRKVPVAWRLWARNKSKRKIRKMIRFHRKWGRTVFLVGDTNIAGPVDMHVRGFKWIRSEGIDKIGVAVPKGTTLKTSDYHKYGAPTDHGAGVVASATFN